MTDRIFIVGDLVYKYIYDKYRYLWSDQYIRKSRSPFIGKVELSPLSMHWPEPASCHSKKKFQRYLDINRDKMQECTYGCAA